MDSVSGSSTHCPFCALQCGMHVIPEGGVVTVTGNAKFPVNEGGLCAKGWSAAQARAIADGGPDKAGKACDALMDYVESFTRATAAS